MTIILCMSQAEVHKGAFQELDQVKTAAPFCKYAGQAASPRDVVPVITAAVKARAQSSRLRFAQGVPASQSC